MKLPASPQKAVISVQTSTDSSSTLRRFQRSARAAIGMESVGSKTAKARPLSNPSSVSLTPNSWRMGSRSRLRILTGQRN